MQNFRFRLPSFFSSDAPSRLASGAPSATASPAPPRPPFRPAGIAQPPPKTPSPQKALLETDSKALSSASSKSSQAEAASVGTQAKVSSPARTKTAQKGAVASSSSSSTSQSPSRGAAPSPKQVKPERQSKQPVSPLKKSEPVKTEEPKAAVESDTKKLNVRKNINGADDGIKEINPLEAKPKSSEEAEQQQKKKEEEKLAIQETTKVDRKGREDETQRRTARPVAAAMEHLRAARDQLEPKTQNGQQKSERLEMQKNDAKNPKTMNNDPKPRSLSIDSNVKPNGEGSSMSKRIKEDIKEGLNKLTWGTDNPNNDEKHVTVVTLTGENRGATMQIASDKAKTESSVHIHRGYKSNPDESPYTSATDNDEGRSSDTRENHREEESLAKTYVNCNNQSINNSIVFDSSVAEHDPGAHVSLRIEEAKKGSGSLENAAAKKPETVAQPPEKKAAYEPRVRRRCLRGLLAESSESETENPQKPRRHGCRFSCKGKDSDSGIV